MNYFLTDEQIEIQQLARKIAEREVRPLAAQYDRSGDFPWPIVKLMAAKDLFRTFIDESHGGIAAGSPVFNTVLVMEELSRACAGIAMSFGGTVLGAYPLILAGNEDQRKRFLPAIASGAKLASMAVSEAQAGSDLSAIACTALRQGEFYVLNGTKKWITNGGESDIYTVFCLTEPRKGMRGASCLIVEKGTRGLQFGRIEDKLGIRASMTREVIFTDCHVPAENLLGPEGSGLATVLKSLDLSRPGIAGQALGIAQGAIDLATEYACERKQFESPIAGFQGLRFLLADMTIRLEAARALTYPAARHIDACPPNQRTLPSAMAKCFASDAAMQITIDALQVFGACGYVRDCPIEKYMRDAKITQIYEGTNQILRDEIGKIVTGEIMRGRSSGSK
jgi:alkylation response protein AidB-like acyl-CoA dehydrogenase